MVKKIVSDDDEEEDGHNNNNNEEPNEENRVDDDDDDESDGEQDDGESEEADEDDNGSNVASSGGEEAADDQDDQDDGVDDDDDDDDDGEDEEMVSDGDNYEPDEDDEELDGRRRPSSHNKHNHNHPSTSTKSPRKKSLRRRMSRANNSSKVAQKSKERERHTKAANKSSSSSSATLSKQPAPLVMKECPVEYMLPEWLTATKPKKSPYFPQIGDQVVYFRQGHELYVDTVKKYAAYAIDETTLPWHSKSVVGVQEYCKVIAMKIEIKPPRLVCLKLAIVDARSGQPTGDTFRVKYHDMPHVVDFVVLRQYYERGIERVWRPRDRFRCIIDDVWWVGQIHSVAPFQAEYPECQFQSLKVLWDQGDFEDFSPWDVEPLTSVNVQQQQNSAQVERLFIRFGSGHFFSNLDKSLIFRFY